MRVALQTLAGDGGEAGQAGVAYLAEVLAGLDGADVDLDGRDGDGLEGIEDRDARVRVGRRVDDDAVDLAVGFLDLVDDAALVVGLEDLDLVEDLRGSCLLADLDQAVVVVATVDARLANAEHVEVGAVDDECFHGCFLCGWLAWPVLWSSTFAQIKPAKINLSLFGRLEGIEEGLGGVGGAVA